MDIIRSLHRTMVEIRTIHDLLHNCMVKTYPDGHGALLIADKGIFRDPGWERTDDAPRRSLPAAATADIPLDAETAYEIAEREGMQGLAAGEDPAPDPANIYRSIWRARAKVRDMALCSSMEWFVTLTLDKSKVDRYDPLEVTRKLNNWLHNRVKRYGLAYILVPERHKDGAIHFHGFFNGALNDRMVESGHVDKLGHEIYNCEAWTLGFTTAVRLYGDYSRAVSYVCKYIGKSPEKIGGRWYYSGGELGTPRVERATVCFDDYRDAEGYRYCMADGTPVIMMDFANRDELKGLMGGDLCV